MPTHSKFGAFSCHWWLSPWHIAWCFREISSGGKKKRLGGQEIHHPRCFQWSYQSFPDIFSDKSHQPQPISKDFSTKGTLGANGLENCRLISLLLLLIGHYIPVGESTWETLMDIVALIVETQFTAESYTSLTTRWQSIGTFWRQLSLILH